MKTSIKAIFCAAAIGFCMLTPAAAAGSRAPVSAAGTDATARVSCGTARQCVCQYFGVYCQIQ